MELDGFQQVLEEYGQVVTVHPGDGTEAVQALAMIQPIREKGERWLPLQPTPLGVRRRDQFLYLGQAEIAMAGTEGGFVTWQGMELEVQTCRPVYVGETLSHWWAVLRFRDGEEEET